MPCPCPNSASGRFVRKAWLVHEDHLPEAAVRFCLPARHGVVLALAVRALLPGDAAACIAWSTLKLECSGRSRTVVLMFADCAQTSLFTRAAKFDLAGAPEAVASRVISARP